MTLKVILDSNFLFIPSQFKIDVFESLGSLLNQRYQPILLTTTLHELKGMAEKATPKLRKQAQLALKLAERCHIFNVKKREEESSDDVIVRIAAQWKCPVATNDSELRRRLRNISIPVVYVRQKSRLELEGSI